MNAYYDGIWFFNWCTRYFGHSIVSWNDYCCVYFCMGDRKKNLFMVDHDDGCGVIVFLGCHAN